MSSTSSSSDGSPCHGVSLRWNAFLKELRGHLACGERLPLREYLLRYEDLEEEYVAREVLASGAAGHEAPASQRFGSYELLERVGRGGQGIVFRARDLALDRIVALKVLPTLEGPDLQRWERFRREAAVASRLQHPGLCTVLDANFEDGRPYIAMPWIPGDTLDVHIARCWSTGEGEPAREDRDNLLRIVEGVARALHVAHEASVVHRDVKPSNVIVRPDGSPVLVDFGLAKITQGSSTLTATGDVLGSPAYMAPESLLGEAVDRRADVYGLGVVLFECVTGRTPFSYPERERVLHGILHDSPPRIDRIVRGIPNDLIAVIERAMQRDRRRRYGSALALAQELERIRKHQPVLARRAGTGERLLLWTRRSPVVAGLTAATGISILSGVVAGVVLYAKSYRQRERAERALEEYARMEDLQLLRRLVKESDDFVLVSRSAAAMDAWLASADSLVERLEEHRAARDALTARALAIPDDEIPDASWQRDRQRIELADHQARLDRELANLRSFERDESCPRERIDDQRQVVETARENVRLVEASLAKPLGRRFATLRDEVQFQALDALVSELEEFRQLRPGRATRKRVQLWRKEVERVRAESVVGPQQDWRKCLARCEAKGLLGEESPLSRGPIEGMVPLGPDPASGLEEFAHVLTGTVPWRSTSLSPIEMEGDSAMVFVLLPGGAFTLGTNQDPSRLSAAPTQSVNLAPFLISKFEVTQGQYLTMACGQPAKYYRYPLPDGKPEDLLVNPVETVSWTSASQVAHRFGMELPTEAQWEYAFRASGLEPVSLSALDEERLYLYSEGTARWIRAEGLHRPVGSRPPNGFGLFDLEGNVSEWCRDVAVSYEMPVLDADGSRGPASGERALRGDNFTSSRLSPAWKRQSADPGKTSETIGFRPVIAAR